MQALEQDALIDLTGIVHVVDQSMVPEGGPPFVHDLGLALWIEVLRNLAHDAGQFPLPRFEFRGVLFEEVEQVLLGTGREDGLRTRCLGGVRYETVILALAHGLLGDGETLRLFGALLAGVEPPGTFVFVQALIAQRVQRIERLFDAVEAEPLLAFRDVVACEQHVVEHGIRLGPLSEEIVALGEAVVAETGVRNHQRLHGERVVFHQEGDTGIGIDDDFVGQGVGARPVLAALDQKMLAEAPMGVVDRQAARDIAVEHLFAGDDFQLVRKGIERVALRMARTYSFDRHQIVQGPLATPKGAVMLLWTTCVHGTGHAVCSCLKSLASAG